MIVVQQTLLGWADYLVHNTKLELLIISVLMVIFAAALFGVQRRIAFERQRREESDRQLLNALQRITHLEDNPPAASTATTGFADELNHADLKTRLQAPATTGNAPDKYRHVASLSEQGMSVAQIAEVLHLSLPEANQLVSLSRIAARRE